MGQHLSGGTITIKDNSKVTAIGSNGFSQNTSCSNPAIGASEKANPNYNPAKAPMNGTITITDNAQVKSAVTPNSALPERP